MSDTTIKKGVEEGMEQYFFRASAEDFKKIPGSPIAYWVGNGLIHAFEKGVLLRNIAIPRQGLATMDNVRFTRVWHEVSLSHSSILSGGTVDKWYPYNKGGDYRKWYGNQGILVNWSNSGEEIKRLSISRYGSASKRVVNEGSYFLPSITWSKISSSKPSFRFQPEGAVFDVAGMSLFPNESSFAILLSVLNSKLVLQLLELLSPTLNFEAGQIGSIPVIEPKDFNSSINDELVVTAKLDWDSYEISWDFISLPLLLPDYHQPILQTSYHKLRTHWQETTLETQHLEQENNRIFIEAYGLQDELTPEVPLKEITLTCNPHYHYGGNKSDEELEALLLADTLKEFISYAVGCMFGRYALEKPGLILANQGETIEDYLKQIPDPTFPADDDNVIPMLDGDWFTDDITERFFKFLRITFGDEHFEDNLKFIEQAIGKDIRKYFLKDFYNDHVKRYKKRPIYWLFSSPKGSFNALIYMHRYRPDTVSVVLNDYLREFHTKLTSRKHHLDAVSISASASQSEKTKALKEIEKLNKMIAEMEDYEREVLYPLATEQVEIDLDDGVKVNYNKFGEALKKIVGLSGKG